MKMKKLKEVLIIGGVPERPCLLQRCNARKLARSVSMNQRNLNINSLGDQPMHRLKYEDGEFTGYEDQVPTWIIAHKTKRVGVIRETWHPDRTKGGVYKKLTTYRLKPDFKDLADVDCALERYTTIAEAKSDLWFYYQLRSIQVSIRHIQHPEWGWEQEIPSMPQFIEELSKVTDIEVIQLPKFYGAILRNDSAMEVKKC